MWLERVGVPGDDGEDKRRRNEHHQVADIDKHGAYERDIANCDEFLGQTDMERIFRCIGLAFGFDFRIRFVSMVIDEADAFFAPVRNENVFQKKLAEFGIANFDGVDVTEIAAMLRIRHVIVVRRVLLLQLNGGGLGSKPYAVSEALICSTRLSAASLRCSHLSQSPMDFSNSGLLMSWRTDSPERAISRQRM